MKSCCALLPLKDLVAAKTRLAGLLSPSERRALVQAMAEDVLGVLAAHPLVDRILLLSDDPGAPLLASAYSAQHVPEPEGAGGNLNALLSRVVYSHREVEQWLVLHADLPELAPADLDAALLAAATGEVVLGPDRVGQGSNLLAFPRDRVPGFAFGVDSCARHRAWAQEAGIPMRLLPLSGVARDVDSAADLRELLGTCADPASEVGPATRRLLQQGPLGARLRRAMATATNAQATTEQGDARRS